MKKLLKVAMAAAMVCLSASLFAAAPQSILKGTTFNLFEDEVVDNFAWGIDDSKGIILGGVNALGNFSIGTGFYTGDLWFSILDEGYFRANTTTTESTNKDSVAKDGINTDYTDVESSKGNNRNNSNNIWNNLYFSFSNGDWGMQAYWLTNDWTGNGPFGKYSNSTQDHDTKTEVKTEGKIDKYNGSNTFGANFKDVGINTGSDLYFQLNYFQVKWNSSKNNSEETVKSYYDGKLVNTNTTKSVNSSNWFYPSFRGEMGMNMNGAGALSTKFILGEYLWCGFGFDKNESSTTNVADNTNTKTTTKSTNSYTYDNAFRWSNTLTPKFVFDIDAGERLSVKASASIGINLNNGNPSVKNAVSTNTSTTTTYYKNDKTTTKSYSKSTYSGAGNYTDYFNFSLSPETDLAFVYQVKPQKLNFNFGLSWNNGTLSWETTTIKNHDGKSTYYSEFTNAAGQTTKNDSKNDVKLDTTAKGDDIPESKETVFTSNLANSNTAFNLGISWFVTEKATLDISYNGSLYGPNLRIFGNGSTPGLLDSQLKLMLAVRF